MNSGKPASKQKKIILTGLLLLFLTTISPGLENSKAHIAFTTILPQKDFVQHIAGDRFTVHALVKPGQSPASYEPTLQQMKQLSRAAVYFRTGVPSENGMLPKIRNSMKNLRIVDLRKGITLRDMTEDHHGAKGSKDPHIWLSPPLVKLMGITIRDALVEIDTEGREEYEKNLAAFHNRIDSLHAFLTETLAPVKGTELFVFHPAFGYFADEYELIQKPVETGGKEPGARELARIVKEAEKFNPRVIFVQPQFSQKSAKALAAQLGCAVVPINPLPQDYFTQMREMGNQVRNGLTAGD